MKAANTTMGEGSGPTSFGARLTTTGRSTATNKTQKYQSCPDYYFTLVHAVIRRSQACRELGHCLQLVERPELCDHIPLRTQEQVPRLDFDPSVQAPHLDFHRMLEAVWALREDENTHKRRN